MRLRAVLVPRFPAACLVFAFALSPKTGAADASSPNARACLVDVAVQGQSDDLLLDAVREVVQRSRLVVRYPGSTAVESESCRRFASVLVELGADDVNIVVTSADDRVFATRGIRRDPSPGIMREEVALVVRSALDALAEREQSSPARPPVMPRPLPEQPVPPRARETGDDTWEFYGGLFASLRSWSTDTAPSVGLGGLGGVSIGDAGMVPSLWLSARYQLPVTAGHHGVEVRLSAASLRMIPSLRLLDSESLRLDAGVGGGVDLMFVSAEADGPAARTEPSRVDVVPVASSLLAAYMPLGGGTALFFAAEGDLDVSPNRYVVERAPATDSALELRSFRVGGAIGVLYGLGGSGGPE